MLRARDIVAMAVVLASAGPAWADSELFYKELAIAGGLYTDELDWMRSHPQTAVGFDYLHKYADAEGDWVTLGLQARVVFDAADDEPMFDLMDAYVNFRRENGRANLRVGRFEIPYGLEPVLDTHGTLLQSNLHHNLGDLWSYGIDLNGQLDTVDYRAALMTGDFSEVWPHREQGSFLVAGRVGEPRTGEEAAWGLSVAAGRVVPGRHGEHQGEEPHGDEHAMAEPMRDEAIDLTRLGADYTRWGGELTQQYEVSVGTDNGDPMASVWARWEWSPLEQPDWSYALQAEGIWRPPDLNDDFSELSASVTYRLDAVSRLTLLAGHAFETPTGDPEDRVLLQYYYFAE